ncbi:MAG TPA: hypothetical protein EYP60_03330 [bacterium (Candidatus Stahlbacteria)]|nr:hypothetical protein [Candidatus Stahlbacteria bacterium]
MKKALLSLVLAVSLGAFIAGSVYACGDRHSNPTKGEKSLKSDNPGHEEDPAECKEKHAKGECKGHEPGQPHMEKSGNPGHEHKEGSAECKEAHKSGKCTGHKPGEHQHKK